MERSSRIITSAAAILIVVSAGFATGDILIIKMPGLGTAIAVLVDSTIVRALLVPALVRVMPASTCGPPLAAPSSKHLTERKISPDSRASLPHNLKRTFYCEFQISASLQAPQPG